MEDYTKAKDRVDISRLKNYVEADLKEIYSTKIEKDLGMQLGKEDFAGIDAYLSKRASENPDAFIKLAQKVRDFKELPERINAEIKQIYTHDRLKKLEKILADVVDYEDSGVILKKIHTLDILDVKDFKWTEVTPIEKKDKESKTETLQRYGKYFGRALVRTYDVINYSVRQTVTASKNVMKETPIVKNYFKSQSEISNEALLKEKFNIKPEDAQIELEKVREHLRQISGAKLERSRLEERLEALRVELFNENFAPTVIISNITKSKVTGAFKKILNDESAPGGSVEKLFELKEQMKQPIFTGRKPDINYIEGDINNIIEELDTALEVRASLELRNAIRNMSSISNLEDSLKPFLDGGERTREFLIQKIREVIQTAGARNLKDEDATKIHRLKIFLDQIELEDMEKKLRSNSWLETTKERIAGSFD